MSEKQRPRPPANVTCPECRSVLALLHGQTATQTGAVDSQYVCGRCGMGYVVRWAPDRPGKWIRITQLPRTNADVSAALAALGWTRQRKAGRTRWYPPQDGAERTAQAPL
jgi:ribosomal protein S27AE